MKKTDYILGMLHLNDSMSSAELARRAGCTVQMVNYVKRNYKPESIEIPTNEKRSRSVVGFFTDLHEPAAHPRFFEFVQDTFRDHGVSTVVCGGDLVDHHFISRHTSEPDALNPVEELELSIEHLKKWTAAFPEVLCCYGNHDQIPVRQAKELGIPLQFVRSLNDIYNLPEGWKWATSWEVDGVLYEHGIGASGMYGFKNLALAYRQSVVVGHTHSNGGVLYVASPKDIIFGCNGGCGMDVESYASRYGASYKFKPTLGCAIIKDGKEAQFIPMDMNKYRR